jgi:uncharacterized protein
MTRLSLSLDEARRAVLQSQGLLAPPFAAGKEGVAQAIDHLGYVQIDTISVVARAHHHTLWARCPDYRSEFLHDLVAVDRRVFEYWAHAIAFLPMSDYRYYLPRMERHRSGNRAWLSEWMKQHGDILDRVLKRIQNEGALTSKDFELPPGTKRGTWWNWKPSKRALEILFWQGHLMISERRNFQKVYDLTERVLPAGTDTTFPSKTELGRFHVERALRGMGLARAKEIRDAFHIVDQKAIVKTLREMCSSNEVVSLSIDGVDGEIYYALPSALAVEDSQEPEPAVILSPFDNLTIHRERMEKLFGFQYTIECYLPAAKRKYGYFVLPILWRNQMIGRMDAKADRKLKTLQVKNLWFEPGFDAVDNALPQLSAALARYAAFNGCQAIEVGPVLPTGHKRALKSLVRKALADFAHLGAETNP